MAALGQRTNADAGGTAARILEHARRAFNERGVAAVGIRDIARELDLSPGNVSYHFATKEALVLALIEREHAANDAAVQAPSGEFDFRAFAAVVRAVMRRDLDNAWLLRDLAGLLVAMPSLWPRHREMQRARYARVDGAARRLVDAGFLDRERTRGALPVLREQVVTQIMFWVSSAVLAAPERDPAERLDAHVRAVLWLFLPWCTPRGRRQLDEVAREEGALQSRRQRAK
jgi:AcrR family transcriptional regulator